MAAGEALFERVVQATGDLDLQCEWDRWYLDYHCAALYRNAVLGCFQPRFVTVLASVVSGQERQ